MVVIGDYSVRLVDAETKEPFKEHQGPGGTTFAEAEPDIDYLIEIEVVGGSPSQWRRFEFSVDGKALGYASHSACGRAKQYKGIWSREDGQEHVRALKFSRPSISKGGSSVPGGLMGQVTVDISEAVYAGTRIPTNFSGACMSPTSVNADLTHAQTKKVLRSGQGSYCESKKASTAAAASYVRGYPLQSITINYCTAMGLIKAGVLASPGVWAEHRMTNPAKRGISNPHAVHVEPKRAKLGGVIADGETLKAATEVDVFDLTADSSDDES